MRRLFIATAIFASVAGCAVAQQSPDYERTIPARFHGEWNENLSDCGTGNNDSSLTITATEIHFYESDGTVRGAFMRGPYEILIVLDMSGEGSSWMTSFQYTLAGNSQYLSARNDDGSLFVRYRCPTK